MNFDALDVPEVETADHPHRTSTLRRSKPLPISKAATGQDQANVTICQTTLPPPKFFQQPSLVTKPVPQLPTTIRPQSHVIEYLKEKENRRKYLQSGLYIHLSLFFVFILIELGSPKPPQKPALTTPAESIVLGSNYPNKRARMMAYINKLKLRKVRKAGVKAITKARSALHKASKNSSGSVVMVPSVPFKQ